MHVCLIGSLVVILDINWTISCSSTIVLLPGFGRMSNYCLSKGSFAAVNDRQVWIKFQCPRRKALSVNEKRPTSPIINSKMGSPSTQCAIPPIPVRLHTKSHTGAAITPVYLSGYPLTVRKRTQSGTVCKHQNILFTQSSNLRKAEILSQREPKSAVKTAGLQKCDQTRTRSKYTLVQDEYRNRSVFAISSIAPSKLWRQRYTGHWPGRTHANLADECV